MQTSMLSGLSANNWVTGPRLMYFVVVVASSLTGVAVRASRLYVCLPLLHVLAQNWMGVLFMMVKTAQEVRQTIIRLNVSSYVTDLKLMCSLCIGSPDTAH